MCMLALAISEEFLIGPLNLSTPMVKPPGVGGHVDDLLRGKLVRPDQGDPAAAGADTAR